MNVLFLTPHLSTGGMPQFLLKRIESIQQCASNIEVFVYEWEETSINYTIQRDKIKELVGDNFFSCGYIRDGYSKGWADNQNNFIKYCYDNKIDVIHIEDVAEYFIDKDYNTDNKNLCRDIFDSKHPWVIVETPHDHTAWLRTEKKFKPNGYAFVIDHNHNHNSNASTIIEYPIDHSIICDESRDEILSDSGWRTTGEYHILNVGLWQPDKNQGYALELARKCWDKYGWTYVFHFVGNQAPNFKWYWEPLMNDLPPNVIIHGEKNSYEVSKFYKMSDVLLFPSTDECNSIVLKEAISNNIKIMAFNLEHYGDNYTKYFNVLSNDLDNDFEILLDVIHSPLKYENDISKSGLNVYQFANKHKEFYQYLIDEKK